MTPPPGTGPVYITGGSSGIGLALARLCVRRGQPVALFARGVPRLEAARADLLAERPGAQVGVFSVDVADADAVARALSAAEDALGPPAYAVASAGSAEPGLFLDQPLAAHVAQMQVNYLGTLHMVQPVARRMAATGGGRIALIASGAAFFGIPGYAAYAPSKFAVRGLAEVLRVELAGQGISVTLCYPPDTDTPQLAAEARTKPAATKAITASGGVLQPGEVAARLLAGMDRGRFVVAPGLQMQALAALGSLAAPALRRWQRGVIARTKDAP